MWVWGMSYVSARGLGYIFVMCTHAAIRSFTYIFGVEMGDHSLWGRGRVRFQSSPEQARNYELLNQYTNTDN